MTCADKILEMEPSPDAPEGGMIPVPQVHHAPLCGVSGSQLNGWPRLRRGSASGCTQMAYPLRESGGPALTPKPITMGLYNEHKRLSAAVRHRLAEPAA